MASKKEEPKDTVEVVNTGLVAATPQGGALTPALPRGGEETRTEDLIIPVWHFLQGTSKAVQAGKVAAGMLQHSLTGETKDVLEFIPIYLHLTRIMFDKKNRTAPPVCRSLDFVHGTSCTCGCNNLCAKCINKDWHDNDAPKCAVTYNFFSITVDDLQRDEVSPVSLRFSKSSAASGQKIASTVSRTLRRDKATGKIAPINMWDYVWSVKLASKEFPGGIAYIAETTRVRKTDPDEALWAEAIYQEIKMARKLHVDEEEGE